MADTVCQWILSADQRDEHHGVKIPVTQVITDCMRMIRSKPITPPATVSALTTLDERDHLDAGSTAPAQPPRPYSSGWAGAVEPASR